MAAATVTNHIATSSVSPPPVVGMTPGAMNATNTTEAVQVTTGIHSKQLTSAVAAAALTKALLINNTNNGDIERDEYTESSVSNSKSSSMASNSPMETPILSSKVATSPTQRHRPHKAMMLPSTKIPNLPPVAMSGPLNCEGDTENANGITTGGVSMASIQLVDTCTQTDILSDEEAEQEEDEEEEGKFPEHIELEVNAEVESEHLRQVPQNREKNHKFTKIPKEKENKQNAKIALNAKGKSGIEKGIQSCNKNVLHGNLKCSKVESASDEQIFSDKQTNGIGEAITDVDNFSLGMSAFENSVVEKTTNKIKNSEVLSEYGENEPVECICNAATQFNCGCDETTANCTYQERIIDYDNFRIIEHVIDCAHESYCNHNDAWKIEYEESREESKDMNFACRELVAFIGESYQLIDNAQRTLMQAQEQTEKRKADVTDAIRESSCSMDDIEDKDIYVGDLRASGVIPADKVDDNNNKGRVTSAGTQLLNVLAETGKTNSNKTLKTNKSAVNSSVSSPIKQRIKTDQRCQKVEESTPTLQLPPPTVALALKALKSKLTPLAPTFHPARKKISTSPSTTAAATATTSSMYAYEQTAIYYQQQPPPAPPKQQQQQQQQQLLQQTTTTTMLHTMSLHQHSRAQHEQQQSPQVSPMPQQSFSKNTFQHQKKQQQHQQQQQQQQLQPLQQSIQQAHNFVASSTTHQQHCAQHGNPLGGMPHIHLHSATGSAAAPTAAALASSTLPVAVGNASQQAHLYPLQVISLAAPGTVTPNANSSGVTATQQQQTNPAPTLGNGPLAWPLLEATPIFIDANGEFRTFCPTHGPPALNAAAAVGATSSNGIQFNHSATTNLALENLSQHSQSQNYKHPSQHHQTQLLSTLPGASSSSLMGVAAPALSINATNRQLSQQQQQKHQVQTKNQNHNKNHQHQHQHHPQQPQHHLLQTPYNHQQQQQQQQQKHQQQHQQQQQLQQQKLEASNGSLQISGKGKLYRGE